MFSTTVMSGMAPINSGSSGMQATPASSTSCVAHDWAGRPNRVSVPLRNALSRRMTSPSSPCPLPETPATPTISPGVDGERDFLQADTGGIGVDRNALKINQRGRGSSWRGDDSGRDRNRVAATGSTMPTSSSGAGSPPNISRTIDWGEASARSIVAVNCPLRSTLMRCAEAITSGNLWVMKSSA